MLHPGAADLADVVPPLGQGPLLKLVGLSFGNESWVKSLWSSEKVAREVAQALLQVRSEGRSSFHSDMEIPKARSCTKTDAAGGDLRGETHVEGSEPVRLKTLTINLLAKSCAAVTNLRASSIPERRFLGDVWGVNSSGDPYVGSDTRGPEARSGGSPRSQAGSLLYETRTWTKMDANGTT